MKSEVKVEKIRKKVKAYSVRFAAIKPVSDKSYLVTAFDGSQAFIPIGQTFGEDLQTKNSDAIWIASWILDNPENKLQHSKKKVAFFYKDTKERVMYKLQDKQTGDVNKDVENKLDNPVDTSANT
jgi:hypothetical protein